VAIPVGFAEERAMLAFEVDPGDVKPEFFGVTAKRDGDRIAHRDPGRQADVVIGATGAGHDTQPRHLVSTPGPPGVTALTLSGCAAAAGPNAPAAIKMPAIRIRSGMSLANDATYWNLIPPSRPSSIESAALPANADRHRTRPLRARKAQAQRRLWRRYAGRLPVMVGQCQRRRDADEERRDRIAVAVP
jgi:hypothetical protein